MALTLTMVTAVLGASLYAVFLRAVRRWQGTGYYTPLKVVAGNLGVIATGLMLHHDLGAPLGWGQALMLIGLPHVLCGVPILTWQAIEVLLRGHQRREAERRELRRLADAPPMQIAAEGGDDA